MFTFAVCLCYFFLYSLVATMDRARSSRRSSVNRLYSLFWDAAKSKYCELSKNDRADGVVTTWPIQIHLQRIKLINKRCGFLLRLLWTMASKQSQRSNLFHITHTHTLLSRFFFMLILKWNAHQNIESCGQMLVHWYFFGMNWKKKLSQFKFVRFHLFLNCLYPSLAG